MNLSRSAMLALGSVFYRYYYPTPESIPDAMSVLKIFDFNWDSKANTLYYEKGGKSVKIDRDLCLQVSPFAVIPVNNLSNFDLDCIEKVLNTRLMSRLKSAEGLGPLLECIGWRISKDGDTYRLHYLGGVDYWEGNLWNEPWDDEGLPDWLKDQKVPERWDTVIRL